MAKNKSECVDTARKALNLFTSDELEEYIKKVSSETKKLKAQGVPFPREQAIKNMNNGLFASMLDDSARSARDIGKWDIKKAKMDKNIKPKAFLDKTAKNTDDNIETANHSAKQNLHDYAFKTMSKEDLNILEKIEADDSIYAVADGAEHGDPAIRKIGEALRNYIDPRNARLIRSDAMRPSEMNEDRFFRNTYDRSKMSKLGRENWINLHKSLIDIEGTFKNSRAMNLEGEIDDAIVNEMIGNTYDNIIAGNGPLFTKTSTSRDSDMIERSRHMFYKYKDWKSWGIGNKTYGQGSLLKSWLMDIDTSSKQIGMAEVMGSQPQHMWNEMRHYQVKKTGRELTLIEKASMDESEALFNNLLGFNKGAYDPRLANIGASIRSLTSVARLGKIALRSIPDIVNIGGISMRSGNGFWGPSLDALIHSFGLIPSEERKILAKQMSSVVNTHSGAVSRYIDVSGAGETINKFSNKFFYGVGLEALDKGNKLSAMVPIMRGFGKASKQTFDKLNTQRQAYLKRFNISEVEWDALRAKTTKGKFSLDNIDNMTDSEIKDLWAQTDKIVPLSEYRGSLYKKVFSMFDTAHEFAVLNPTAYSNMWTTGNTLAGTKRGELVRMVMQFKGYPIQWMRRIFVGGMQDMDSYQGKMMYALNMALGTIMLTQMSDILTAISNGLTPPDPRNMSRGEAARYYTKMLAGGTGIFGVILNSGTDVKKAGGQLVGTPSLRAVSDPLIAAWALGTGDLKGAERLMKDWVNVANPIATAPIVSPFVDKILGNKPYLEPGQHPLF